MDSSIVSSRYPNAHDIQLADGWQAKRLTQPSRLYGANGLRTGPDGRLYVAQVPGSQISAINIDSGEVEAISPKGGGIVAPDDLVFDDEGNIYATEITEGRVSRRDTKGNCQIICADMPCANPITMHQNRLFAGECRPGGRLMELDVHGGAPTILLEDVPMPNAMEVGPDGMLYFPVMGANEIWRISPQGGTPEVVATDLGVPDAVKFDADGFIVSTQVASGQVLRINPQTGEKTILATIAPGLDNLSFVNGRLFVSSISGQINEIVGVNDVRPLIPDGLQWPMGLAVAQDNTLFIADGGFSYTLQAGGTPQVAGMLFSPGYPGFTRGVIATAQGEWLVTTANGEVARFWPAEQRSEVLASGFDQLMGLAKTNDGAVVFVEYGTGRLLGIEGGEVTELATNLEKPMGVTVDASGTFYVAESGAGRVTRVASGKADTFVDGLNEPHGIAVHDGMLLIVDVSSKELMAVDLMSGTQSTIASNLAIGAPVGVTSKPLGGVGDLSGPMTSFCGVAVGSDGTIYVAGDGEGAVLALFSNT